MDPGNWGTDIAAGSRFGYALLWVVFASSMIGILVQYLSAKLGLATRRTLSENCRVHYPRPASLGLWLTAETAAIATDLAEVLGGALALNLLFGIDLFWGAVFIGADVLLVLALQRWGFRKLEAVLGALVATIGVAFLYEMFLIRPDVVSVAVHTVTPDLPPGSLLIAIGILGATVMPHNVFLHSALVQWRLAGNQNHTTDRLRRFALADTGLALTLAWMVNSAILIMSAAVFFGNGVEVASIEEAHRTLKPLVGGHAALAFAVALLASGLASSTTATLAGQVIMEGFLKIHVRLWVRRLLIRLITLVPALIAIGAGADPLLMLVLSQVVLSLQLPFTLAPLIHFTSRKDLMGTFANRRATTITISLVAVAVLAANVALIVLEVGAT